MSWTVALACIAIKISRSLEQLSLGSVGNLQNSWRPACSVSFPVDSLEWTCTVRTWLRNEISRWVMVMPQPLPITTHHYSQESVNLGFEQILDSVVSAPPGLLPSSGNGSPKAGQPHHPSFSIYTTQKCLCESGWTMIMVNYPILPYLSLSFCFFLGESSHMWWHWDVDWTRLPASSLGSGPARSWAWHPWFPAVPLSTDFPNFPIWLLNASSARKSQ